jgi:hypothetical protein
VECVDIERVALPFKAMAAAAQDQTGKLRQQHPRRCMRAQQPLRIQQRHPARFDRKALMHLENFLADIRGIDMDFEEAGIGLARQRGSVLRGQSVAVSAARVAVVLRTAAPRGERHEQ